MLAGVQATPAGPTASLQLSVASLAATPAPAARGCWRRGLVEAMYRGTHCDHKEERRRGQQQEGSRMRI